KRDWSSDACSSDLDEHALEFARGQTVVTGLEHVIGPTDVGDEPVLIAFGHIAGVVDAVGEGLGRLLLIGPVPAGQADGTGIESEADFTLVALLTGGRVDENDVEAGQRLAHRPVLELLVRRVADLQGRFGLAEAVADE